MTTTGQHITAWVGEDKTITVTLTDCDGSAYGSTSGLTFYWWVSRGKYSTDYLIQKYSTAGITNGTSQITITLNKADTEDMDAGSYYQECRVIDSSDEEDIVWCGGFTLYPSTTVNWVAPT